MIEKVLPGGMIHLFDNAGSEGGLFFSSLAKNDAPPAISMQTRMRSSKQRDNFDGVARKQVGARLIRERFTGSRQVHSAGIPR